MLLLLSLRLLPRLKSLLTVVSSHILGVQSGTGAGGLITGRAQVLQAYSHLSHERLSARMVRQLFRGPGQHSGFICFSISYGFVHQ